MTARFRTIIEALKEKTRQRPDGVAFRFLIDGESVETKITYAQLDDRANLIARLLLSKGMHGKPVLLAFDAGLEFIEAFMGCLYAGAIAVPVKPPSNARGASILKNVAADCAATVALGAGRLFDRARQLQQDHAGHLAIEWINCDDITPKTLGDAIVGNGLTCSQVLESISSETLAYLQYTSGSTRSPRGVMVTHGNALSNVAIVHQHGCQSPEDVGVQWLPHYHDMGLVNLMYSIIIGFPMVILAPTAFLQRPVRWLQAISHYRARFSGAPNFAYALCVDRIDESDRRSLNLGNWTVAFCGAEIIRRATFEAFAQRFAEVGFSPNAYFPCYGLAESTAAVCARNAMDPVTYFAADTRALQCKIVQPATDQSDMTTHIISCGRASPEHQTCIVDPTSMQALDEKSLGEIWLAGSSISSGYWQKPDENRDIFQANIVGRTGNYLRTGDVGFLYDGQLYITGRMKDLIIIRGANHYPSDIEFSVQQAHEALSPGAIAAFAVDINGQERLAIAAELKRDYLNVDKDDILTAIRQAVSQSHDLETGAVLLLRTASIPKTSSGKIQRFACRDGFYSQSLDVVGSWIATGAQDVAINGSEQSTKLNAKSPGVDMTRGELQAWIVRRISDQYDIPLQRIDVHQPFSTYGMDSLTAVSLASDLERLLGRTLPSTFLYDNPTIQAVVNELTASKEQPPAGHEPTRPLPVRQEAIEREPIAIVGMGCRVPGADSLDELWRMIVERRNGISDAPESNWHAEFNDQTIPSFQRDRLRSIRKGGFVAHRDSFDAEFFGIAPREAAYIDPQHRLMMELFWEAIEDAGIAIDALRGSDTGVFVGISTNDYAGRFLGQAESIEPYWVTGNAHSIAANRLSYLFDLRGPSLAIDTACSSSLVATHLACQSIHRGDCNAAVVGGVNLIFNRDISLSFAKGGAQSPDGQCRAFDASANGMVRSEGAGVVILKRLSRAIADGDHVYAVIAGSAINQDGRSNGLTAPRQAAQEEVLREACRQANISPARIQYVEGHGAGTPLGDVMETRAIQNVLGSDRDGKHQCAIGSVKTNIGHCEAAAGVIGLIKTAMAIDRQTIPPLTHFRKANPNLGLDASCFELPTAPRPWASDMGTRIAGVSSFGFGGTNAHLILQSPDAIAPITEQNSDGLKVLVLSAGNATALEQLEQHWAASLGPSGPLADKPLDQVCAAAATRRSHLSHRLAITGSTADEMHAKLKALVAGERGLDAITGVVPVGDHPKRTFVFAGHGAQWWAMGRELLKSNRSFRDRLEQCDHHISQLAGWSLLQELSREKEHSQLEGDHLEIIQTSLFALQLGLAQVWQEWGVVADAVVGHSIGEIAAACYAGCIDLPTATKIVLCRSRALQRAQSSAQQRTGMAAIRVSAEDAVGLLAGYETRVTVAVSNSPVYTILCGELTALEELLAHLKKQRVGGRLMNVPGAGHSPALKPMGVELATELQGIDTHTAAIPFYSTILGRVVSGEELGGEYWGQSIYQPVQFAAMISALIGAGHAAFVELSPHPILNSAVSQCAAHINVPALVLPSLRRDMHDVSSMLTSLAHLHVNGHPVRWRDVVPCGADKLPLPTYPWQRKRHWIEAPDNVIQNRFSDRVALDAAASPSDQPAPTSSIRSLEEPLPASLTNSICEVTWHAAPHDAGRPEVTEASEAWLIFADAHGVGVQLAQRLRKQGGRAWVAHSGMDFQKQNDDQFTICHSDSKQLRRLFEDLNTVGTEPLTRIVYCLPLDAAQEVSLVTIDSSELPSLVNQSSLGATHSLGIIRLLQELKRIPFTPQLRLDIVTSGAVAVPEHPSALVPCAAAIWGMSRTLLQEVPKLKQKMIDIAWPDNINGAMRGPLEIDNLYHEILSSSIETEIALRASARFASRLSSQDLAVSNQKTLAWNTNGTYLITGGLGGLALQVANWMAEQGARRLILMSRTGLPPRSQWCDYDVSSVTGRRIAAVREIESKGTQVHVASVDVAHRDQLRRFLVQHRDEQWPPIRGVMHLAGSVQASPIDGLTDQQFHEVYDAKAVGAWNIHCLMADSPLDFFVMFSSGASLLGSPLLASYAAANAYLDGLAHYRHALGLPAQSINWGYWSEVGMAARVMEEHGRTMAPTGMLPITNADGLKALQLIMQRDCSQIGVLPFDWPAWAATHAKAASTPFMQRLCGPTSSANQVEASLGGDNNISVMPRGAFRAALLASEDRRALLVDYLASSVAKVLQLAKDDIDLDKPLNMSGIDSLMAIELKTGVEDELRVEVPMARFLEGPSIQTLTTALLDLLQSTCESQASPIDDNQSLESTHTSQVAPGPEATSANDTIEMLRNMDNLSDDEITKLLASMTQGCPNE